MANGTLAVPITINPGTMSQRPQDAGYVSIEHAVYDSCPSLGDRGPENHALLFCRPSSTTKLTPHPPQPAVPIRILVQAQSLKFRRKIG